MADGAAQMTVDFTFTHDGQRWRVRRVFHANTTPSSHLLQNLDTGEHTDNARAVNRKIETLLQLDFDSFTTAVLLPQGKFDRLLTATGGDRAPACSRASSACRQSRPCATGRAATATSWPS